MKNIIFVSLCLLLSAVSFSQERFLFYSDFSIYKYSDSKSIIELYFSVNQRDLNYKISNDNYVGQANIEIVIYDKLKDKIIFDDLFGLQSKVTDTSKANLNNKIIGQQNFTLNPGEYVIKLLGCDFNKKSNCDSVKLDINVSSFDNAKTSLSDVQLASNISKSDDKNSIFYKNGLEVTPNPDALFGMNLKTISYYFEIYSIKNEFPGDNNYLVKTITDFSNNVVKRECSPENSKSDAFFKIGSMNIDSLDKGVYFFKVMLLDSTTGKSIEKEKKFFVYNVSKNITSDQSDSKGFLSSEYKTMSLDKLEDEYNKVIYIRTSPEKEEYNKLKTLDEKRKFMYEFWRKRNKNLFSNYNEYKIEYFKRVNESNLYYKQGFMEGWKTDRGRIYITYGKPSDVESHPSESDSRAYEIWTYENIQGGAICVFGEKEIGSSYYHLLHSTIRGEFQDEGWSTKIKK